MEVYQIHRLGPGEHVCDGHSCHQEAAGHKADLQQWRFQLAAQVLVSKKNSSSTVCVRPLDRTRLN